MFKFKFACSVMLVLAACARSEEPTLPLLFEDDFEKGADRWQPNDPEAWKIVDVMGEHKQVFSHFKQANYQPKHRSPINYALVKDLSVSDFVLEANCQSTVKDYPHRDLCLFFGYQGPNQYYYAHLGKTTDDHANQIFIVNNADRTKISTKTTNGTPWTDDWHHLKVVRKAADGTIEIYFDDMQKPCQTATDKTFPSGQVGIGTFDDLGNWDDVMSGARRPTGSNWLKAIATLR